MNGKTILVTGGTAGIGRALAQALMVKGAKVIITGRDRARVEQAAAAMGCAGYVADSADSAQLTQLAAALQQDHIRLDGLVLNAGVFYPDAVTATTEEAFDLTMAINTKGPFITLQQLQPLLNNPSSVVFVSSIAVAKAFPNAAVYAASKAAFEAIVRVANLEFAPFGIRINSIRPGVTATDIQGKAGMSAEQQAELFGAMSGTALGRVMTPEDQIGAIEFLLSDQSLAMRSAVVEVDGGFLL
ncbi:SDR family NAD(P)-dependent oxidoreductase [Zobellella denitrificans]